MTQVPTDDPPLPTQERLRGFLDQMCLIRALEEKLLQLFSEGKLYGTTHTSIGQEAVAVAAGAHFAPNDYVLSAHRCHGHYIAYGGPPEALLAEIMGRDSGVCGGRGGSQHLHYRNFFTSGVQGGIAGLGTGLALARKLLQHEAIAVVFLGDGTLGEGLVYESFNFASLHALPVLFILENNRYAQSTPITHALAGSITARAAAFDIPAAEIESNDVLELDSVLSRAFQQVRQLRRPFLQVVHTYRLAPHSKGDDYRDPQEIAEWRKKDPLLLASAQFPPDALAAAQASAQHQIERALQQAMAAPLAAPLAASIPSIPSSIPPAGQRFAQALNQALHDLFAAHPNLLFLGEDLADPYGGAFAVSRGLSTAFPERVISTPISEAGIVAWATGAALGGMECVAEIMFGDFLALAADQIINHASKFAGMYCGLEVPLVIRTPMGGRRGYGPTHSQSLESIFCGVPGLTVVAPNLFTCPRSLLEHCLSTLRQPVLFIEHKLMYAETMQEISWHLRPADAVEANASAFSTTSGNWQSFSIEATRGALPTLRFTLDPTQAADAAIVTYGHNAAMALDTAKQLLLEHEILVDVLLCTQLAPAPMTEILEFTASTRCIVTLEEGPAEFGWGSEIIARLAEHPHPRTYLRIGAKRSIIPAAGPLEAEVLPQPKDLIDRLLEVLK